MFFFFFSSRRRHTISVSAFLPNRSSDLREMRLRLGKVTVADVLAAQPVMTNLLKFMRASIKMIGVSNLQSFIASMTQKLTLSDISDESKNYLDKAGITTACLRIKSKRSEERFSRNAETDLVCRLLLEKKNRAADTTSCRSIIFHMPFSICSRSRAIAEFHAAGMATD